MSRSFVKLLVSQLFANLADIFLRVSLIANIFVITKSVIATSMVPILIGLSAFMASFLVPLVTKIIPLNRVLFFDSRRKNSSSGNSRGTVYQVSIRTSCGDVCLCNCYFYLRRLCSTGFLCHDSSICYKFGKGKCRFVNEW